MKKTDIYLNKKEKKEVLNVRSKIRKTNNKFVKLIKNPPIEKIEKLNKMIHNQKDQKTKIKKKIKAKKNKLIQSKENKLMPDLFVKLETENVESYKIRKKFIENNLPKTPIEYKIIVSLSIILVNKIFYKVKYSESIEKVLKEKLNNMEFKKELKNKYFLNI